MSESLSRSDPSSLSADAVPLGNMSEIQQEIPADVLPEIPPEVTLDGEGRVDAEVPCIACGYILKAALPQGRCPECGSAVIDSLRGGLMHFASRDWLESLWDGTKLMIAYLIVLGACMVVIVPLMMLVASPWPMVLIIASSFVWWAAVWRVTAMDGARPQSQQPSRASRVARFCAVLGTGLLVVSALAVFNMGQIEMIWFLATVDLLRSAAYGVGFVAMMICAGYVALRIPAKGLATQTKVIAWGVGGACVAGVLGRAAYYVIIAVMMSGFASGVMSMGPVVPAPATPGAAPSAENMQPDGSGHRRWSITRSDGSIANLDVNYFADGSQSWDEQILDVQGNTLAAWTIHVDSNGDAHDMGGSGSPADLEVLKTSAQANQVFVGGTSTTSTGGATPPPPPNRAPDSTQTLGANLTIQTWNATNPDGSQDIYMLQTQPAGDRVVTQTHTDPAGNATTTTTTLDTNGQVTSTHTSSMNMSAGAFSGMGNMMWYVVLTTIAAGLQLLGAAGWLGFGIWAYVLVFYFRKHIEKARAYALAIAR